jgi:hypothetical protein
MFKKGRNKIKKIKTRKKRRNKIKTRKERRNKSRYLKKGIKSKNQDA